MGKTKPAKKPAKSSPAPAAKAKAPASVKTQVAEFEQLSVPFSTLAYNPKINARGDAQTDIEQLAETIKKEGLVQPIAVRPAGKKFEPLEGGRRFRAIEHLVRTKAEGWTADTLVPVISRKLTDAQALEASIAAHVTRLDLTPAQEAVAFHNLQKEGRSVDEIAASFAMPARFVHQRLAIGSLPATILKALRAGEIDTRTAEAFTLTNDAALQLKLFTSLAKSAGLNHQSVRQQLTGKATRANDPHARFVGEAAYVAAGGTITTNLFGDEKWFDNGKLLGRLFDQKIKERVELLEADGWSFVRVERDHWWDFNRWTRLTPKGEIAPEGKRRIAELDTEISRIKARMAELDKIIDRDDGSDSDRAFDERQELHDVVGDLKEERQSIPTATFTSDQKARSGIIIRIEPGRLEIMYGMVDPAVARAEAKAADKKKKEKEKARAKERAAKAVAAGEAPPDMPANTPAEEPDFAGALKAELAQHMSRALKIAIADRPQAAHYALIATLIIDALPEHCEDGPIAIVSKTDPRDWRTAHLEDRAESEFDRRLAEALQVFVPVPPEDKAAHRRWKNENGDVADLAGILAKLEVMEHDELMRLQALLVARALKINYTFMLDHQVSTMIQRFDPAVEKVWTPDKEFFSRLKKPDLVEALGEAAVANVPRSGSKGQLVELALAHLPAAGWLPKPMRAPSYAGPGSNAWADAQGARVAEKKELVWRRMPGTSILDQVTPAEAAVLDAGGTLDRWAKPAAAAE